MKKYCEKWKSVYQNLTALQCEALLTFSFMAITAQGCAFLKFTTTQQNQNHILCAWTPTAVTNHKSIRLQRRHCKNSIEKTLRHNFEGNHSVSCRKTKTNMTTMGVLIPLWVSLTKYQTITLIMNSSVKLQVHDELTALTDTACRCFVIVLCAPKFILVGGEGNRILWTQKPCFWMILPIVTLT
jgi:hypothetical protein